MDQLIEYKYEGIEYLIHVAEYGRVITFYLINPISKFCSAIKTYQRDNVPIYLQDCLEIWRRKYYKNNDLISRL